MVDINNLGRLEKIKDLRDIWDTEDRHFTPWLAQEKNISILGEVIGLSLKVEAQEKEVGPFRADILCRDTANDNWVLIENQLERTDHTHLGQLITYASGLKAVTIVWIVKIFTEEHRSALDWLNEITDESFNFFGLEIELWKIGESAIAPKFNIVSKPNDWSRSVVEASAKTKLTDAKLLQREYWEALARFIYDSDTAIKPTKPLPQHWMNIAIGKSGIHMCAIASYWDSVSESYDKNEIRVELILDDVNAKSYFDQLEMHKEKIENEFGQQFIWHNPENTKQCRVFIHKTTNINNKGDWTNQHEWLLENLEKMKKVFSPFIKNLILE